MTLANMTMFCSLEGLWDGPCISLGSPKKQKRTVYLMRDREKGRKIYYKELTIRNYEGWEIQNLI